MLSNEIGWNFDNTYSKLPESFISKISPIPVKSPELTIFNYFIFKLFNKKNSIFILKTLEVQAFISIGFILFTVLTSNPFDRIFPAQPDGLGFNPILQDPALAIHPPLLYVGYVGFSAAFSLSIATLSLNNNEKIPWYNYMKPFVLAAWTFLTIGIALGSIWAYYELGWGGWWFWDLSLIHI